MLISGVFLAVILVFPTATEAKTRTYYIGAVEEDWNYAPQGNCVNRNSLNADPFIKKSAERVGSVYRKVLYRQFTNNLFRKRMASPAKLGMLGPMVTAEEGDTIVVFFKNMAMEANRNFSIHPHGVQYNKNAEGALYVDRTTGTDKRDDGVAPGHVFRYVWRVTPQFAPTTDDDRCLPWAYHSHVSSTKDVDSGLVGLLLTCRKGTLARWGPRKGMRKDVRAEFPIYLDTADENESWLVDRNLQSCSDPAACAALHAAKDAGFARSNRMAHVNGRAYGNLEGLVTRPYARSVLYFFSLNRGVSSVHIGGQMLNVRQHSVDSVTLFPATFVSALLVPRNRGAWLLASRNVDAYAAGQQAFLHIKASRFVFGRKKRSAIPDNFGAQSLRLEENVELGGAAGTMMLGAGRATNFFRQEEILAPPQDISDLEETDGPVPTSASAVGGRPGGRNKTDGPELASVSGWKGRLGDGNGRGGWFRPRVRRYYLAIEDYEWDYGPSGQDLYNGGSLTQPGSFAYNYFVRGPHRIGGVYRKSRYVQFADRRFTRRVERTPEEQHLGMMGPVLKAEVGETVVVVVKNMADRPYSFVPHGVTFTKANEGFVYNDPTAGRLRGNVVRPGQRSAYRFRVPALGLADLPCVTSTYTSGLDPVRDVNTGLLGPLLLCQRGQLRKPNIARPGTRHWYQRHQHVFLNFFTLDENLSWHLRHNIDTYTTDPAATDITEPGFRAANRKHAINGRMFGNLEGLRACRGENVAWHLLGVGGEYDMHGVNWHGQTLTVAGSRVNAKVVVPGTALTLTALPDTVGNWSVACRTNFHFLTGMTAQYEVAACGGQAPQNADPPLGVTRRYFIAAQEVDWDYAPHKRDLVTGLNLTNDSQKGYLYVKDDDQFIGSVYRKARYVEYTDATYTTVKPRPPTERHLGILGPVIQAEVGDVLEVVFFNNASRPYSIHPQGVQYTKDNEGANYQDGSGSSPGTGVAPGTTFIYTWRVPARAGPAAADPPCLAWMYYSSVNSVRDMASGLVGPLLVCEPDTLSRDGGDGDVAASSIKTSSRMDVDREFWMLYYVFDENLSWYLPLNAATRAPNRTDLTDPTFQESNRMNAINGLIFGNVEGLDMNDGDVAAWYLLGLGSTFDYHPVHFHGHTFTHKADRGAHRGDVLEVFPSTSQVVRMLADNPGTWIVHCHFSDHAKSGMEATYTVHPTPV